MTWIELIYSLPFILMGGCIFSFADVVADRLPRKISFVKGRSYCPSCDHTLAWYDMIPVVSWLLLRGKCRQCRCRIPARYPVTEAMGMAAAEISLLCFGGWNGYWHEINLCVVTVFSLLTLLLIIAQIDQQTMEIPNGLVIACIVPAAIAVFAFPDVTLTERLIGFFSVSLPLFAITLAVPGAFDGGDRIFSWLENESDCVYACRIFRRYLWNRTSLVKEKGCKRAFCIWPVFVRRDSADFICGRMAAFLVSIHNFLKGGLMPKYQYTAKDVAGKKKKGQLMAADEAALYELLRGENLFLISCRLAQKKKKNTYRLNPRQLSEFCRQLGTLLGAGVPLVRALNLMQAEETIKPKQKAIYENMIRSVRRGNSFADTMKDQGDAFPELLINMFRAAQESGRMDQTALRMAEHYQKEYRLSAKIKSATLYPKILCGVIVVVVMILFCYIMPKFMDVFANLELPAVTVALMAASGFMQRNWLWVLFGIAVLYVIAKAVLELPKIRLEVDRIKLKIPKIGILIQTIYTARFARTLCSLYTSGLPIVTALQVSKDTIGNSYLESQFDETIAMVRRGESLSDALAHIDGFHKKLAGNVAIGEETGSLDTMLISAADNFEYESEQAISRLISFLEPAMIIVMAVIVGMIMIAVMLPLLNMYAEIEASGTM